MLSEASEQGFGSGEKGELDGAEQVLPGHGTVRLRAKGYTAVESSVCLLDESAEQILQPNR